MLPCQPPWTVSPPPEHLKPLERELEACVDMGILPRGGEVLHTGGGGKGAFLPLCLGGNWGPSEHLHQVLGPSVPGSSGTHPQLRCLPFPWATLVGTVWVVSCLSQ